MSAGARASPSKCPEARMREDDLQNCQRRLEYLGSRLQDLAVELGDGQGAIWLKQNMWFLQEPAKFVDDILFGVGKLCDRLVTYLDFHKQKLASNFPFRSFISLMYEVRDLLGIVRDMLIFNPAFTLSVKQSQIDSFWSYSTPFLFIFQNKNHTILKSEQIPVYLRALLDLVPTVIQVGLGMYCSSSSCFRGFECFAEMCLRLSKALVETGEFLSLSDRMEPVIVPFLRQWVLYALELVQLGVRAREDNSSYLTPNMTRFVFERGSDETNPKSPVTTEAIQLSLEPEAVEKYLAPIIVHLNVFVRTSCQPCRWIEVARARLIQCPNENRKHSLEEICLRENQKLVSDIFLVTGTQPRSWDGIKLHCPLIKRYNELKMHLFIKVKKGESWLAVPGTYEELFDKGWFLTFEGTTMNGFVAVEERPMVTKDIGPSGGTISSDYDPRMEAVFPKGSVKGTSTVKMMIQPPDEPRERQYRERCPEVFQVIKSTSNAVELEGATMGSEGNISIKIPYKVLRDSQNKILVLKYNNDNIEVGDESVLQRSGDMFTVQSHNGGTVLATVDRSYYDSRRGSRSSSLRDEMEVILGKRQLCKLMIFVEPQSTRASIKQCVFCIVCAEKYRVDDVLGEKGKVGLLELPKSQSPDRLLKQADDISLDVKGNILLDDDIPPDAYNLTYLEGSDNYFRFPVNLISKSGRITFILRLAKDNSMLHTFFYDIEDLLSLIGVPCEPKLKPVHGETTERDSPTGSEDVFELEVSKIEQPEKTDPSKKEPPGLERMATALDLGPDETAEQLRREKEASLRILSRNSLVILAKHISRDEGHLLGVCLGMKAEKVGQIYKTYRHSAALATFTLLYEWRGRHTIPEMTDKLLEGLREIDRADLARIVKDVRKRNRVLSTSDFEHNRRSGRR